MPTTGHVQHNGGGPGAAEKTAGAAATLVVGTGLVGLAGALALALNDLDVVLVGPAVDTARISQDMRTTALFGGSIAFVRHAGVWLELEPKAEPLRALRIVDDAGGWLRAPEVLFEAEEMGETTFGWNFRNGDLLASLWAAVVREPRIRHVAANLVSIAEQEPAAEATLSNGTVFSARLIVGADGAGSKCRLAAGIESRSWTYPQAAIATEFSHSRPHGSISTEFHRRAGPLTTVPLPGKRSSLVWVETSREAERLRDMPEHDFAAVLGARLQGLLGDVEGIGRRVVFPLGGAASEPLGARRIGLVGDAAHRLPPIGAQGLNLGIRDVAWLAEFAGREARQGGDPGCSSVLEAYSRARRFDVASRTMAVDALNKSLYLDILPLDLARHAGLALASSVPMLRRRVMRSGMHPEGELPPLLI